MHFSASPKTCTMHCNLKTDIKNLNDNERNWIQFFNWAAKATTNKMVAKRLEKLIFKFSLVRLLKKLEQAKRKPQLFHIFDIFSILQAAQARIIRVCIYICTEITSLRKSWNIETRFSMG